MIKYIVFGLLLTNSSYSRDLLPIPTNFLAAISKIESNNNDWAVGDNGKSISRYQIQYNCYLDAKNYDKTITFSYESLTNKANARKILIAYLSRYCKKNDSFEVMARTWNGGPNGKNKTATINYWNKIRKELTF